MARVVIDRLDAWARTAPGLAGDWPVIPAPATGSPRIPERGMEYRIFGPLEARRDGAVVEISGTRQMTVLALLLVEANRIVPIDRLVDGVWNETPPATSRGRS